MDGLNWNLEDDYQTVTVTFPTDPIVQLKLNVGDVENMLKELGRFRGFMKPEIAPQFPMGQKVEAVPDPAWVTEPDLLAGNSLLHLRDPRYGWLHYLLPREGAEKLAGFLQKQADAPPLGPSQSKPN
jgi:hypothetical protein